MNLSEIINIVLGGGLIGTAVALFTLRATVRKAKAEAMKAEADAETVRIDNAEHATRILVENIVKPLKEELNDTKRELLRNTREMARLRKALNAATSCDYSDSCPVLNSLREQPKGGGKGVRGGSGGESGQCCNASPGSEDGTGPDGTSEAGSDGGQPP